MKNKYDNYKTLEVITELTIYVTANSLSRKSAVFDLKFAAKVYPRRKFAVKTATRQNKNRFPYLQNHINAV